MAEAIRENPDWIVKLSSSSLNISAAVAKLISYQYELLDERKKDDEFFNQIKSAHLEAAEIDLFYSEEYMNISSETDSLIERSGGYSGKE